MSIATTPMSNYNLNKPVIDVAMIEEVEDEESMRIVSEGSEVRQ